MSVFGFRAPAGRRSRIVAVFASEQDRSGAAPRGRQLGTLDDAHVRPAPRLIVAGAAVGFVLGAFVAMGVASILDRTGAAFVSGPVMALAAGLSAIGGAIAGMIAVARAARSFVREVNGHVSRGRVVVLVDADRTEAATVARELEEKGALEATILPAGLILERIETPIIDLARARVSHGSEGATILAGGPLLASTVRRSDLDGVSLCVIGREGHTGPVHSSTAGPAWVHSIPPTAGEGWSRSLQDRLGKPLRVRFADGELVLMGEATRSLVPILSGHVNDSISSALSRIAEAFGCPDASARVVVDQIDGGAIGVVVLGEVDARRHAVDELSRAATASSEGTLAVAHAARRTRRVA